MRYNFCPIEHHLFKVYCGIGEAFAHISCEYLLQKVTINRESECYFKINGKKSGAVKSISYTGYFFCGKRHGLFIRKEPHQLCIVCYKNDRQATINCYIKFKAGQATIKPTRKKKLTNS